MKVDVCISYFRRKHYWPLIAHGLERARPHINRVIVVNAEPWEDWTPRGCEYAVELPRNPGEFNYSAMVNRGIELASSNYVVHIDDDVILKASTLPDLIEFAQPDLFLAGNCHDVPIDSTAEELIDQEEEEYQFYRNLCVPQGLVAGPLWLVNRKAFLDLGGFDENLTQYSDQDGHFTLEWMTRYGTSSCVLTKASAYQIAPGIPTKHPKPTDPYYYRIIRERIDRWKETNTASGKYRLTRTKEGLRLRNEN